MKKRWSSFDDKHQPQYHQNISFTSSLKLYHKLSTCIVNSENAADPITQTMEIPASLPLSNNTILAITEMDHFFQKMDQFIPKELQMPAGIAVCRPLDCVCRQFVWCAAFILYFLLMPMYLLTFFLRKSHLLLQIGVLAIVIVLGLTKFSSSKQGAKEVQFDSSTEMSFKSPVKSDAVSKTGTPVNEKTGTVMTPAGRRSARLARRKED